MKDPFDILERLDNHIRVAIDNGGADVTKNEAYYRYRLSQLSDDQRAELMDHCESGGCWAMFGDGATGGKTLTLRKKT
jgi:hypothetical protein